MENNWPSITENCC